MLSKNLFQFLFGRSTSTENFDINTRVQTFYIPGVEEGEEGITIKFRSEDGLIYYLIKRMEKLEKEVRELKNKKK